MNKTISGGDPAREARMMQMFMAGAMTASIHQQAERTCAPGWTLDQGVNSEGDYEPYCTLTLATGIQLRFRVDVMGHEIEEE